MVTLRQQIHNAWFCGFIEQVLRQLDESPTKLPPADKVERNYGDPSYHQDAYITCTWTPDGRKKISLLVAGEQNSGYNQWVVVHTDSVYIHCRHSQEAIDILHKYLSHK